jgi:hypothetical protein
VVTTRRVRGVRHVEDMGQMRRGIQLFQRPGCRWEVNMKVDTEETEFEGMDWIYLAQDRAH